MIVLLGGQGPDDCNSGTICEAPKGWENTPHSDGYDVQSGIAICAIALLLLISFIVMHLKGTL